MSSDASALGFILKEMPMLFSGELREFLRDGQYLATIPEVSGNGNLP